jgi:hypothetical protein
MTLIIKGIIPRPPRGWEEEEIVLKQVSATLRKKPRRRLPVHVCGLSS